MNEKGQRLLKRLKKLAGPQVWGWEDRDALVEILEVLIEEVFREEKVDAD
jgi:hypothetical protein